MGLDIAMVAVGEFGKYQRRIFILLCLVGIPFSVFHTGPIFWANIPKYQCESEHPVEHIKNKTKNEIFTCMDEVEDPQSTFGGINDEKCYEFSLDGKKDNETKQRQSPEKCERKYCVNYTFEDGGQTTIISRVSEHI